MAEKTTTGIVSGVTGERIDSAAAEKYDER
jgi:hypothetical protein